MHQQRNNSSNTVKKPTVIQYHKKKMTKLEAKEDCDLNERELKIANMKKLNWHEKAQKAV